MNNSSSISSQIVDYVMNGNIVDEVKKYLHVDGLVVDIDRPNAPVYGICGMCGIVYLKCGESAKGKSFEESSRIATRKIRSKIASQIPESIINYLENCGCPILAVLQQNMDINELIYEKIRDYGINVLKLKKVSVKSYID